MKLLHLFSTFAIGGPQARAAQLVAGLGDDIEHLIMPLDGRDGAAQLLPEGGPWQIMEPLNAAGSLPARLRAYRRFLSDSRPSLICTYNWGAIEWAMANRFAPIAPHLHFEDGFGPEESGNRQIPRRVWFRRLALSGKAQIVVPSATLMRIATRIWRLPQRKIHHILNGIDLERFTPDRRGTVPSPLPTTSADTVTIVSVGALRPEKNYALMIDAVARASAISGTPPLRLVLVGEGTEKTTLEQRAIDAGVSENVHFTGNLTNPETALLDSDIFGLSSITEQMPISLVEAMGCGLPAVATEVGDIRAMLPESAGRFLVQSGDRDGLAGAISRLAQDPELRLRLGAENRARAAEAFDEQKMIEIYRSLIDEMIT